MHIEKTFWHRRFAFALLIGDMLVSFCGLTLGYLLRFHSPLTSIGQAPQNITYEAYQPLLWLGTIFLVLSYSYFGLHEPHIVLRPRRSAFLILRSQFIWFLAFLGFSLAVRFTPDVSRLFVIYSCAASLLCMVSWRYFLHQIVTRTKIRDRLNRSILVIGWSNEAEKLVDAILTDPHHPYTLDGILADFPADTPRNLRQIPHLGCPAELEELITKRRFEIIIIGDDSFSREQMLNIANVAERNYIQIKLLPSFFQIFVSSLRMQTISGVPILGIDELPITQAHNQLLKRTTDIIGGIVGLLGAMPIMLILSWLVYRESPGPVLYKQTRTGLRGRNFTIYKLRSMRLDAETAGGAQWAQSGDTRRLKIGAFMREWNLDELPQFWNVLIGDMSLVGPRPERPELIKKFEIEIPHYNPRHEVRPGLTGWAQVNGLRGNTSLVERIKFDLCYIENWSYIFDWQIMFLTFFRRKNAY
jgi:exopolysaccharide biosynthesis polyprenyl glycosylphosphotransferase